MAMYLGGAEARILLNIDDMMRNAERAESRMRSLDSSIGGATTGTNRFRESLLGIGTALIPAVGIGLKAAMDLEQGIANVNASLGGLPQGQLDALAAEMQRVGVASQYSATEVAAVADELAKAGYDFEDIVGGRMTQAVVDLSQATGASLDTSVSGITATMAIWREEIVGSELALGSAAEAADIFTIAANESSASVDDIIAGVRNFGPSAAAIGVGFDESAAAIAFFTNNGLKAADAGVSLTRGIENLLDPTAEASALMDQLGIDAFDMEGNFVGLPTLFDQLQGSMKDMSPEARQMALSTLFGAEALDVMTLAVLNGGDPLRAIQGLMDDTGVAAEQSALRMDTLKAQLSTVFEGATTLAGSFLQGLLPAMRLGVDGANAFIDTLMRIPAPIKTVVGAVAVLLATWAAVHRAMQAYQALDMILGRASGRAAVAGRGFSLLSPPLLLAAGAAAVLYGAWKINLFGLRDLVGKVVDGVTGFIDDFGDAWDELSTPISGVMEQVNAWGGIADAAGRPVNRLSRFLLALSRALKGIAGDNAPDWLVDLADGLEDAADLADDAITAFDEMWDSFLVGDRAVSGVMDTINRWGGVTDRVSSSVNGLSRFLYSMGAALDALGMDRVSDWFANAAGAVDTFVTSFADLRSRGLDPVRAGLVALADVFPVLLPMLREAYDAASDIGDAFSAFRTGDWRTGFDELGSAARNAWAAVREGVGLLADWTLNVGAPALTGWIVDVAGDVWGALQSLAGWGMNIAGDIGAWVLETGAPAVAGWVLDVAGDIGGALLQLAGWGMVVTADLGAWVLDTGAPTLGGWIARGADAVERLIQENIGPVKARIREVIVDIGQWARGELPDVYTEIEGWLEGGAVRLTDVVINVAQPTIQQDWAPITSRDFWFGKPGTVWRDLIDGEPGRVTVFGQEVTVSPPDIVWDWPPITSRDFWFGKPGTWFRSILDGSPATATASGGGQITVDEPTFLEDWAPITSKDFWFGKPGHWLRSLIDGEPATITVGSSTIDIGEPDINWDWPPLTSKDFWLGPPGSWLRDFIDGAAAVFDIDGPSINIGVPDINWPDMPDPPDWMERLSNGQWDFWNGGDGGDPVGDAADQEIRSFIPGGGRGGGAPAMRGIGLAPSPMARLQAARAIPAPTIDWSGMIAAAQTALQTVTTAVTTHSGAWPVIVGAQSGAMSLSGSTLGNSVRTGMNLGLQAATLAVTTFALAWPIILTAQAGPMSVAGTLLGTSAQTGLNVGLQAATVAVTTFTGAWPVIITAQAGPMQTSGNTLGTSTRTGLNTGLQAATTAVTTFARAWPVIIRSQAGPMQSAGTTIADSARTGLNGGLQRATTSVTTHSGAWPRIVSSVEGRMRASGTTAGRAATSGVADGMLDVLWRVTAAANMIAAEVDRGLARAMEQGSPAKRYMPHGRYATMGVAGGMTSLRALRSLRLAGETVSGVIDRSIRPSPGWQAPSRPYYGGRNSGPPVQVNVPAPVQNQNQFLVVSRELLEGMEDTVEGFRVLTSQAELRAVTGRG